MTEIQFKALQQPERWKLIAEYQKRNKIGVVNENRAEDMNLLYKWLSENK